MVDLSYNHFPQIGAKLHIALALVIAKTSLDGQKNVQSFIVSNGQVDTGFMLNSVYVDNGEDDLTKYIRVGAEYAEFQNYGTRYLPARPFWEPGLEQTMIGFDEAMSAIESQLAV